MLGGIESGSGHPGNLGNGGTRGGGKRVLITGGAGFIGSHVADELLRRGYRVRALDNLSPQVHGAEPGRPGAASARRVYWYSLITLSPTAK